MKAEMTKLNSFKTMTMTVSCLLMTAFASTGFAQESRRLPLDSKSPFYKIIAEVSQLKGAGDLVGDAWFYGKDGCMVVTNFHVAFGKTKDSKTGNIVIVDKPNVGHKVNLSFDINPKTEMYKRNVTATVIEFGNYEDDIPGLRGDIAVLRLSPCAGPEFSGPELDRSEINQKNPTGKLMTVSTLRKPGGKRQIVSEVGCQATPVNPVSGVVAANCEIEAGMSGSPVFVQGLDGVFRVTALNTRGSELKDGTKVALAVSGKVLSKLLDSVTGESPVAIAPQAENERRPQSEQTAQIKPVTVVR